jgi:hypothetical protein
MRDLIRVEGFPANTVLQDNTVLINAGGPSPDWVLELARTRAGLKLLGRILGRLLREQADKHPGQS